MAATPTADAAPASTDPASLERQLQEAREEAELTLEQLHLVQEELEVYFLRCEELEAQLQAAPGSGSPPAEAPSTNPAALPIESIGRLMTLLIEQLSASELTALAHACHRQHRHHLALPLLDAAVSKLAESDPEQAAWAQLQAVRTRLALGRRDGALRQLHTMAEQQLADLQVRVQIHRQIAWLALQKADLDAARHQLAQLEALDAPPEQLSPLRLALQLAAAPGNPAGTRLPGGDRCGASLDLASISGDGRLLQLEGWHLDLSHPLSGLLLIRPQQVLAIQPEQLDRRVRHDLASLQSEQGLPASHPAGFTIRLALGQEEAVPFQEGEFLVLALLRSGADPILLGRPAESLQTTTTTLYSLVAPVLNSSSADPADVSTWTYPPGC
jgi:hypothetical protein